MKDFVYDYQVPRVCSKGVRFSIENGLLYNVSFVRGCNGNTRAIGKLLEGTDARKAVSILKGNDCEGKGTSCADQLAIAIEDALNKLEMEVKAV